jgi:UDP-N-acetylmuramoylalanine-D-glutamate ligase
MSKIRKQIKQIANLCARSLTAKIRRFFPSVPILTQWPGFGVVMKGVHRRTSGPICERILMRAARYRRRHLSGILVVGITGSVGKTTTKDILAGILAKRYLAHKTNGTSNHPRDVARTVLFTPPKTNVCILELSGHRPGGLDGPLEVAQPRIAVVTNIGMDHISAFR